MTYSMLLVRVLMAGSVALLGGCASETLFESQFNNDAIGGPPAHNQATGTLTTTGAPGGVVVVGPVPGSKSNEHWVKISRTGDKNTAPITEMPCTFAKFEGDGTYTLLAALFIPSKDAQGQPTGLATVEFDTSPVGSPANAQFLHLDFMQNGTVRMDDGPVTWGTFPHDQFFTLAVTLDIGASTVAHMSLFGTGASGQQDYNVPLGNIAHQIGGVKFWMGFPWLGSFDVTDILVTKKTS